MADDMQEFFADNAQWVGEGEPTPVLDPNRPPRPPKSRKDMRRSRRKKQMARRMRIIIAVVLLAFIAIGGWFAYSKISGLRGAVQQQRVQAADYPGPGSGDVQFTVETGDDSVTIGDNLAKAGIVKSSEAFQQAVVNSGLENQLQPGTFELRYRMNSEAVVKILTDSTKAGGFLVVNPGERASAVISQAAEISGIDKSEFQKIVNAKGQGILPAEANGNFEGWLEPGNYNVKGKKSASQILKDMVDKRIEKLDSLGVPTGSQRERVLIIASIVEGEVNRDEYYGKVSRVIENRLAKDMSLGMDSTVAYGANVAPRQLTNAMLNNASNRYNTRINKGLPPTPINQPGDSAITAAMNPEQGDWLYFVTVNLDTGETKFATTAAQHEQYKKEYEQWEASH
ncbi:YceG-like family [Bifidobacterium margollesii]|uniref:Endolytic murein transglycosylase n=1 Tax=Bifidobacterium margollesii TaxID=2020964 RepID=A0A2N5J7R4_9BIFI|nr:endolytic transglycosylase MltG [Bifidobacterium margollesii]PLS30259.1 YceG-like family [Bifidobacterium margollesii]